LSALDQKAAEAITAAVQFAEASPSNPDMLWDNIYADKE